MLSPLEQIAMRRGITLEELRREAPPPPDTSTGGKGPDAVKLGPELARILALPRRPVPTAPERAAEVADLARRLTEWLARHPDPYPVGRQHGKGNTGYLNAVQAAGLAEIGTYGGMFGPIRAGGGKTLLCALACPIVGAKRPLYVCPANLRKDVFREFTKYAQHWHTPRPEILEDSSVGEGTWEPGTIRILSYQALGVKGAGVLRDSKGVVLRKELLERLDPDLVLFDEAHFTANLKAAVTRRVRRWHNANLRVPFVDISGTMIRTSLLDYAHLVEWSMPRMCPLPRTDYYTERKSWADAIDERDTIGPRTDIGALVELCTPEEVAQIAALRGVGDEDAVRGVVRGAVGRRILETPGCVATQDGPLGIPLTIDTIEPANPDPIVGEAMTRLRSLWELPNGRPIAMGLEMHNHARREGLGYWATWDPPPPDEWLVMRREWCSWQREVILHNRRGLDSEKQVKEAVASGLLRDGGLLAAWEAVEPQYDPEDHIVAEWLSDEVVVATDAWLSAPGRLGAIVWVQDVEVGERLSRELKIPYFGQDGLSASKVFILDHTKGKPMIASVRANRTGRNLQHGWSDNLWLSPPEEQGLARTHRPGQMADSVRNTLYVGCREHVSSFWRACRHAKAAEQEFHQAMRLCYAEIDVPALDDVEMREGPRWQRAVKK